MYFILNKQDAIFMPYKAFNSKYIPDYMQNIRENSKDFTDLYFFRQGGIGDLIALSSLANYFKDKNIHFITQKGKYDAVFNWFTKKCKIYEGGKDIFIKNFTFANYQKIKRNYRFFAGEGLIEMSNGQNWYEVFYKGISTDTELFRPSLITERLFGDSNIYIWKKPSLLICNLATSSMRSFSIETIYNAIENKNEFDIYTHDATCTIPGIRVIHAKDLYTYLLDLYDSDYVITTDTGAIHFREGVQRPALGLYTAFTTGSRTKYYKYTKSINIKSSCPEQPCFLHEYQNGKLTKKCKYTEDKFPKCSFDLQPITIQL